MIERVDGGGTTKDYEISVSFHRLVMDSQWTRARKQGVVSCRNIWVSNKRYYSFGRNQLKLGAGLSGRGKGRTSEQYIVYLTMISITHFIIASNCRQIIG